VLLSKAHKKFFVSLRATGKKKKKNLKNSPNPCAASAMITSAEHGCSLFVLSLFFLVVLVLLFAHVVEDEDANSRRRAAAEDDDDKSSLRSIWFCLVRTFF